MRSVETITTSGAGERVSLNGFRSLQDFGVSALL